MPAALALLLTAQFATPVAPGCGFDPATLAFAGTRLEQARCLLRRVGPRGVLVPQPLPAVIAALFEDGAPRPDAGTLAAAIDAFPEPFRSEALAHALDPVSHTAGGQSAAYFVIHDTSTPFLGAAPFPRDLDDDPLVNDFAPYFTGDPVAHLFLNRRGEIRWGHDLAEGWRATKLESRIVGVASRGRFLHVETIQPRRVALGAAPDNQGNTRGPDPGFSPAQYRMLAALYLYASARAGTWLVPAFHATVDAGIPDAHDDPQNFDLNRFGREVARLLARS